MKRIAFLLTALLVWAGIFPANGQYTVTSEDNAVMVESSDGRSVVNINREPGDRMKIQVAGVELMLSQKGQATPVRSEPKKISFRQRYNLASPGHIGFLEIGINMLPAPKYYYPAHIALIVPYGDRYLELDYMRSWQFAFCLTDFSLRLAPHGIVALTAGLQMVWNNYVFSNPVTIVKEYDRIFPVELSGNYKKSKLSTFGFRIPVILEINLPSRIFIAGGIYGGVNLDARAKVKRPKTIVKNPFMETFYYGLTARLGHDSFFLYGNYDLSSLFQADKGVDVCAATVGIGLSF